MLIKRKGVTLIELILAIALVGIIIQGVYSIFFVGNTSYSISTNRGFSQQDVRLVGDFLVSEMKYISDLTLDKDVVESYYQDYYSLEIEILNEKPVLIRTFHKYMVDPGEEGTFYYNTDDKKMIHGNWDKIEVINDDIDLIDVLITQNEGLGRGSSSYELPLSINLVNGYGLQKGINIDLMTQSLEGEKIILFYQKAENTNVDARIDIVDISNPNEGGNEGEDDPDLPSDFVSISGSPQHKFVGSARNNILVNDIIIQGGTPVYSQVHIISGDTNQFNINISDVKNEGSKYWIEISGSSNGNGKKITIEITVTDKNGKEAKKTISMAADN